MGKCKCCYNGGCDYEDLCKCGGPAIAPLNSHLEESHMVSEDSRERNSTGMKALASSLAAGAPMAPFASMSSESRMGAMRQQLHAPVRQASRPAASNTLEELAYGRSVTPPRIALRRRGIARSRTQSHLCSLCRSVWLSMESVEVLAVQHVLAA